MNPAEPWHTTWRSIDLASPPNLLAELLLDVDLSILGATTARFGEHESQVRFEYSWVPEAAYRDAHGKVFGDSWIDPYGSTPRPTPSSSRRRRAPISEARSIGSAHVR